GTSCGDSPALASVPQPCYRRRLSEPSQFVVRFARARFLYDFSQEEDASLAVMRPLMGGEDKFIRYADATAERNPQAAFLARFTDGGLLRGFRALLAAA